MTATKKAFPFKLGTDPEFSIVYGDKKISAQKFIECAWKGKTDGNDFKVPGAGDIGVDGHSETAELRVNPENTPEKLTKNIGNLIAQFSKQFSMFELLTKSDKGPVGGHIHLEVLKVNGQFPSETTVQNAAKKLASFYVPLMLNEDIISQRLRSKSSYCSLSDNRYDSRPNDTMSLEFRAPGAEWMTTPKITNAMFAYFGCVWHEIHAHPENVNRHKDIILKNSDQMESMTKLAVSHLESIMEMYGNKIKKIIKTFEFYPQYKKEIDFILNAEAVITEKRKANYDLMQGWKFVNRKIPAKRSLMSDKKFKELADKTDLDSLARFINVQSNHDFNIDNFVHNLKSRVVAHNWKLDKEYFFFGLKKGVNDFLIINKNNEFLFGLDSIKTKSDWQTIRGTFERMNAKFAIKNQGTTTNSDEETNKKYILIGIPYELRRDNNTKDFISLVHDIDSGKYKLAKINEEALVDADGEIYKAYNNPSDISRALEHQAERGVSNTQSQINEIEREMSIEQNVTRAPISFQASIPSQDQEYIRFKINTDNISIVDYFPYPDSNSADSSYNRIDEIKLEIVRKHGITMSDIVNQGSFNRISRNELRELQQREAREAIRRNEAELRSS